MAVLFSKLSLEPLLFKRDDESKIKSPYEEHCPNQNEAIKEEYHGDSGAETAKVQWISAERIRAGHYKFCVFPASDEKGCPQTQADAGRQHRPGGAVEQNVHERTLWKVRARKYDEEAHYDENYCGHWTADAEAVLKYLIHCSSTFSKGFQQRETILDHLPSEWGVAIGSLAGKIPRHLASDMLPEEKLLLMMARLASPAGMTKQAVSSLLNRPRLLKRQPWFHCALFALLVFLCVPGDALAHREDYLEETLVYLTLHRAELEPEYWVDLGRNRGGDLGVVRHDVALEYGITERWMIDARATLDHTRKRLGLSGARLETRYRFSEEGKLPLDVAVSGELNTEESGRGSQQPGAELRLILSKDHGKSNFTLNLAEEFPFRRESPSFNPAFGYRHNLSKLLNVGTELKYSSENRRGSFTPQIWFLFPHGVTLKMGVSAGFGCHPKSFARVALEIEF